MQPTAANGTGTRLTHRAGLADLRARVSREAGGVVQVRIRWQLRPCQLSEARAGRVGKGKAANVPDTACFSVPIAAAAAGSCEDEDAFIEGVR